jgi:hypothetical protein
MLQMLKIENFRNNKYSFFKKMNIDDLFFFILII